MAEPGATDALPAAKPLYVQRILDLYRQTPSTGHVRQADRRLAAALHDRRVRLDTVHAALLLATGRRTLRPAGAAHGLPKISSLHYFLPVIDELLARPLDPDYLRYLRARLAQLAPGLVAAGDHRFP